MLLRTIVRKQGQQALLLGQLRNASNKASPPRPSIIAKVGAAQGATSSSSSTTANNNAAQLRNRKLTPTAKAKAQASASRALREELASIVAKDGSIQSSESNAAIHQKARKDDQLAQTIVDQPNRRLNDAIAFATAESYDFKKLISSNRLPAGWQLLEDDEVIYIPHWPHPTISSHTSSSSTAGGEVFVFQSGSYVTWGLSNEQSSRFLRSVLQGRATTGKGQSAEADAYTQIGDEAMEYIVADDQ